MVKQAANSELLGMFRERRSPAPESPPETAAESPETRAAENGRAGLSDAPQMPLAPQQDVQKAAVARAPREPRAASSKTPRLTADRLPTVDGEMVDRKLRLPRRTLDRLRSAAAYSTPHTSLGRLAADAIEAHIDQLEKRRGSKFPELEGELPPGRRVGT